MAQNKYQTITFAEGYNKTYEQFVKEFSGLKLFKNMPEKQREIALKEAHKKAIDGNTGTVSKNSTEAK